MPVTLSRTQLYAIAALLVVLVAAGVLYGMVGRTVHASADNVGPPAALAPFALSKDMPTVPQVAFSDAAGNRQALSAFKGHYVLLNLWAPWCAPCVKELPALAALKAAAPNLTVVAVDVGRGSAADAKSFLSEHGIKGLDTYVDTDLALLRAFGAFGLPLTVLIGPDGREIGRASGPVAWDSPDAIAYFRALPRAAS
jgi:thiol-disulfide isomerase/thioredoxin